MIITPTEHDAPYESSDPAELLIKEARQKARRRRLTVGAVLLAALLVVVLVVVVLAVVGGGRVAPKKNTAPTAANTVSSVTPKCNILNMDLAYGGKVTGVGTMYDVIKFTDEKATCAVSQLELQGVNLNASHHEVGPSLTASKLASVTLKHDQSVYLPVGVVDTNGVPPLGNCDAAEITGVQIHFPWDQKSYDNSYVGFGDQTVCTSRLSLTVAPYQPKA